MHVATILNAKGRSVLTARHDDTIRRVIELLSRHNVGAVIVCDADGSVVGILSERDIVRAMADLGAAVLDLPAEDLMTRDVITCKPSDTVPNLMSVMTESRVRHLPVVEDGILAGVVSIGDVVKARIAEAEQEIDGLRQYVMAQG